MSTDTKSPGGLTKTGATVLFLLGSILTYVFVIKIFARIWDSQAYLQHPLVAVAAGLLFWGGVRIWARWRLPLGVIWLLLGALAFVNSTQYRSPDDFPKVPGFRAGPEVLRALSRASIVMGCVGGSTGLLLLSWDRVLRRREGLPVITANETSGKSVECD